MTLGNIRHIGLRSLVVRCGALWCDHQAVLNVSNYVDDLAVPALGPHMVCTICRAIGADVRPDWAGTCATEFI